MFASRSSECFRPLRAALICCFFSSEQGFRFLPRWAAALLARGAAWSTSPFPVAPVSPPPFDQGLQTTDSRLQQILVEMRVQNLMLQIGFNIADDPKMQLRPDVLLNDSSLTT